MKAERRHELKENDLAHAIEVARKYLDENGKRIGFAVVVVMAVLAAVGLTVRSRGAAVEDMLRRRGELRFDDPEKGRDSLDALAAMTRESSDEQFVLTGLLDRGEQALRLAGEVVVPPDRELNDMAREAFEELLERFGDNPLAKGIAHCGLATVEENYYVLDHDLAHKERAEAHLSAVIEDPLLNGMPFKRSALDRRNALDRIFTEVVFVYPEPEEEPADEPGPGQTIGLDPIRIDPSEVNTIQATATDAPPAENVDQAEPVEPVDTAPEDDEPEGDDPSEPERADRP